MWGCEDGDTDAKKKNQVVNRTSLNECCGSVGKSGMPLMEGKETSF